MEHQVLINLKSIITPRLIIREWALGEEEILVQAMNNTQIFVGLYGEEPSPNQYKLKHAIEYIKSNNEAHPRLAITLEDTIAGEIEATFNGDPQYASINYWIHPDHQGKGIATEALRAFSEYLCNTYHIHHLEADVLEWNIKSIRTLENAGYHKSEKSEFYMPNHRANGILEYIRPIHQE